MKSKDKLCSAKLIVVSNFLNNFYSSRSNSGRLSIYRRLHKHIHQLTARSQRKRLGVCRLRTFFSGLK